MGQSSLSMYIKTHQSVTFALCPRSLFSLPGKPYTQSAGEVVHHLARAIIEVVETYDSCVQLKESFAIRATLSATASEYLTMGGIIRGDLATREIGTCTRQLTSLARSLLRFSEWMLTSD